MRMAHTGGREVPGAVGGHAGAVFHQESQRTSREMNETSFSFPPCTDRSGNRAGQQRFGPINTQTGHRRLNVLFTRAKEQVVVFSSRSLRIFNQRSGATGASRRFAATWSLRSGFQALRKSHRPRARFGLRNFRGRTPANARIRGRAPGRRGRLLCRHRRAGSDNPSRYLAGIECDGATYHSASPLGNDRLRQERLEKLGGTFTAYGRWIGSRILTGRCASCFDICTALQKRKSR